MSRSMTSGGALVTVRPTRLVDEDLRGWLAISRDGTGSWRYVPAAPARRPGPTFDWCPNGGVRLPELCHRVGPIRPVVSALPWQVGMVSAILRQAGPLAVSTLGQAIAFVSSFHGASALTASRPGSWEAEALVTLGRLAHREWWTGEDMVDEHAASVLGWQLRAWVWGPGAYVDVVGAVQEAVTDVADELAVGPAHPDGTLWDSWQGLCHPALLPERGPGALGLVYRYLMSQARQFDPELYP
jgi:hypothetical protein